MPPNGQPASSPVRWGIGEVALGLLVSLFASTIAISIALGATGEDEIDQLPMWLFALVQTSQWVGLAGVPILAAKYKGAGVVRDFGATMQARDAPVGFVVGVALQLVMVPLVSWPWLTLLGKDADDLEERARDLTDRAHGFGLLLLVVVLVAGAPLVEELFFRGLALRAFDRRLGAVAGLVTSAVLFGATHLDLLSLPALVVFGLVVGLFAQRTGRLGLSVWTHVGFNATTVTILLLDR